MKKTTSQIKNLLFTVLFIVSGLLYAQIGIGTTTPAGGSVLDISSADKGILVPRVNIADLTTITPITGGTTVGLLVWNTNATTGAGFHYWDGGDWIPIGGSSIGVDWALAGNAITAADFLGTTNAQDLQIRTDNTLRARVLSDGRVIINELGGPYFAGDVFTAEGDFPINGYTTAGIGVYGEGLTGNGVWGESTDAFGVIGQSVTSSGVRGFSDVQLGVHGVSNNIGVWGDGSVIGVLGDDNGFDTVGVQGQTDGGIGVIGLATSGDGVLGQATSGDAIVGVTNDGLGVLAISTNGDGLQSISANSTGAVGASNTNTETGIAGTSDGGGFYASLIDGSGVAGEGNTTGVYGVANTITEQGFGGYFENDGVFSYVGGWQAGPFTARKILGNGTVSTIVEGTNGELLTMSAPESPEILFQDYGIGKLENGKVRIEIDPIFSRNIRVDAEHPMKVFIQLEGDCNGVFVTNKSATGFEVIELQQGNSNVDFSWSIVATRADAKIKSKDGSFRISQNGGRFQPAPGPMKVKRQKINKESNPRKKLVHNKMSNGKQILKKKEKKEKKDN